MRRPPASARRSSSVSRSSSAMRARSFAISPRSFSARSAAVACSASGRSRFLTSSSRSRARSTCTETRASFSSARWRRALKRPRPAASSISARRSSGFEARIASTLPWPMIECMPWPRPRSARISMRSSRRTGVLLSEVLPLAAAVQPPRDRELGVVDGDRPVLVVEQELDLAEVGRPAVGAAREEHVVRLLGAQLVRAERAGGPADRVRDVRFPGSVRPDDHADARLEANLDRVGKRLEATELYRAEMHVVAGYRDGRTATRPGRAQRSVLVRLGRPVVEELEDPALGRRWDSSSSSRIRCSSELLGRFGVMLAAIYPPGRGSRLETAQAATSGEIFSSASRAASCSAAFFEPPSPTPSCSPSTTAAHVKCRSCGGPSAESTM